MANDKLTDPVEKKSENKRQKEAEEGVKTFTELTEADFKQVPISAARATHPFDGYPIKPDIELATMRHADKRFMASATFVVALSPERHVYQDPSNREVTIYHSKTKKDKVVALGTYFSQTRIDYDAGKRNTDVVFDRMIPLSNDRWMRNCAVVPSHFVRAQLMFRWDDRQERILPDRRFVFLDGDQTGRLRRLYQMIINPKIRVERLSRAITGESQEALEEIPE